MDGKCILCFPEVSTATECLILSQFCLFILPGRLLEEFVTPEVPKFIVSIFCLKKSEHTPSVYSHTPRCFGGLFSRILCLVGLFFPGLCEGNHFPSPQVPCFVHCMVSLGFSVWLPAFVEKDSVTSGVGGHLK